jgi:hypothetical protein
MKVKKVAGRSTASIQRVGNSHAGGARWGCIRMHGGQRRSKSAIWTLICIASLTIKKMYIILLHVMTDFFTAVYLHVRIIKNRDLFSA